VLPARFNCSQDRKFSHALVVGVERCPRKVVRGMSQKKIDRKSRIKPFVKYVNYNHLLATRFLVKDDFDFKGAIGDDKMETPEGRKGAKAEIKKILEER
jgi:large subunit ribosomal protein L27e